MQVEIIMPKMGESIFEGTIIRWAKKVGDKIEKDETILEISTDKVDSEIPSPAQGVLTKILVEEQQTVPVGIGSTHHTVGEFNAQNHSEGASTSQSNIYSSIQNQKQERHRFYSPLVRMMAKKEGVEQNALDSIAGSGSHGRVTKHDLIQNRWCTGCFSFRIEEEIPGTKLSNCSDGQYPEKNGRAHDAERIHFSPCDYY